MSLGTSTTHEITFVVIAYNEERNIAACLRAILAQRGLPPTRVVVVDDGSTDSTAAIVRRLQIENGDIQLVSQANAGRGAARSIGFSLARGDLIAMVDADIILPPNWFETCIAELDGVDAVGGVAVPDGDVTYIWRRFGLNAKPTLPTMPVAGSNALYRRELLSNLGFDRRLREGEDTDLNLRMLAAGRRARLVPDLFVQHVENKSFAASVTWLFECGSGATRHLLRYRRVRLPDLAWGGLLLVAGAAVRSGRHARQRRLMVPCYIVAAGTAHLASRFDVPLTDGFGKALASLGAESALMACYFAGRTYGLTRWSARINRA